MADLKAAPVKLYYRIGEVSEIVGVEPHVLRYWETEFKTIRPQKSRKGQRIYSRRDVDKLLRVKDLLYVQGYTIAGARKQLRTAAPEVAEVAPDASPAPALAEADAGRQAVEPPAKLMLGLRDLRSEVLGMLRELEGARAASSRSV
ncbi:MAG: MerR family transcriptional regulator [Polyangiaceae bacterium]|nr:MerR family transcriptional regulator [Polyangiaceae bacterium]MCW5790731.1 MerR family transcriptional regulator [Polyangiaceae bacterium]